MSKEFDLIIIGQLTLDDVVLFDQAAKLDSPGGSGLYALAGLCFWGEGRYGFVTRRGNDYDLSPILSRIGHFVDTEGIVQLDVPSIHNWSLFDRKGNRYFIKQRWGSDDDLMGIYPKDIPEGYFNSNSFLVSAFPVQWQFEIIKALPSDSLIIVDPHFQGVYPQYHDEWNELFKKIDIFLPSEEEIQRFFSINSEEDISKYIPYLKEISHKGPFIVGVKLGERGVLIYDRKEQTVWHVPAFVEDQVVDVTGCGDAFCGGFVASYLRNRDTYLSAIYGVVSSSLNLEDYGVVHNYYLNPKTINERLNNFKKQIKRSKQKIQ